MAAMSLSEAAISRGVNPSPNLEIKYAGETPTMVPSKNIVYKILSRPLLLVKGKIVFCIQYLDPPTLWAYNPDMNKLEYEDLSEKVYNVLKDMILKSELVPGTKLVQEELSERLGVSRTPLLSALTKLEKELLVEFFPRRGAYVRKCSIEDLKHCYDIRIRLETLAAREAASAAKKDPPSAEILKEELGAYRVIVAEGNAGRIKEADYQFHMSIVDLSGNLFLKNMISSFSVVLMSNQRGLLKPAAKSLAEHEGILAAILAGDAVLAERLMLEHLDESRRIVEKMVEMEASGEAG